MPTIHHTVSLLLFQGTEIIIHDEIHIRKALKFQILFIFLTLIYVAILLTENYLGVSLTENYIGAITLGLRYLKQ